MISSDEIVSNIRLCLLNGDSKSVGFLENFVLDSWNWQPIIYIIEQHLIDDYLLHFTFTMASRRIKLFGVSDINDLQSLFNTILSKANCYDDSNTTIINDMTKILSLLTINSPSNDIFGYVDSVKNSLISSQGNRISFLLLYLTDIGMVGLSAENNQRLYLKEMSSAVLELCRTSVTSNVIYSNPRNSDISITCNAINCINQWIIADLLPWNIILPSGSHYNIDTVRFLGVVSPLVTVTYPTICQSMIELLETIIDKKKSETVTSSNSESIDDDTFAGLSSTLIQNITQHANLYVQTLNTSNSSLACGAYLRLACLTATLLGPYISSIESQPLLHLIVLSTKHTSLKVAGIAIEIFPEIHRFLSKLKRKQFPHIKELYPVLLESMLRHAVMPAAFGDLHDDGSIDEDEWLTYREQSISNVLLLCYYELRADALMIILNGIQNNCFDSYNSNNNTNISINTLEAKWFCIRVVIFEVCKRALLHHGPSSALLAASKASPASEAPQEVKEDASQTSSILYHVLELMLHGSCQGSHPAASVAAAPVVRETCRILGLCSTWMSRAKDSDGKERDAAVRSSTAATTTPAPPVKEIINLAFSYLLNAISSPLSVYRATASLRSLCQHCAESVISSVNLDALLLAWTRLCYADESYREAIEEERFGQLMEGEGDSNYLLESQKAMLKSCCLLLSHCPVQVTEEFQFRILEPMLAILQSGLQESRFTNLTALSGVVDLLAFFVRSVRLPARPPIGNGAGLASLSPHDAFTSHPSVQLMGRCGTLFLDLLKKYPSESQSLGTSIGYLMTSLVTFIAPLAPVTSLPDFLHFAWSTHMKQIIPLNYSAACDFVSECVDILGPIAERVARATFLGGSSSSLEPPPAAAACAVLGVMQDMMSTMHIAVLQSNSTSSVQSPLPSTACTMLGAIVVIEICDLFFSLLSRALTVIPVTLFSLSDIESYYQMAKLGLLEYTQPSLIRSTVMLLTTLMNLESTVGFIDADTDAAPSDCGIAWAYISPKVKRLEPQFDSIALEECLVSILGTCPKMLVEVFASLLFRLIKNGMLHECKYYVSEDFKEILQVKAKLRGALNYTDDLISLFFMICSYVSPKHSRRSKASPLNQPNGYILSEFLDVCGVVWKVAAGESNVDALRNYATQKASMM